MYIGLTLREYNECTPYELGVMIKQHAKREEDSLEKIRIKAWLTAKLTTPKVPPYKSVFKNTNNTNIPNNDNIQHEGLAKNKMHKKQIERHLEEFKKGGLQNGKLRKAKY